MSKKKDLEVKMTIILDRKAVEKQPIAESLKTVKVGFDFLIPHVTECFEGAIENLKKTGKLRWPSKKYGH